MRLMSAAVAILLFPCAARWGAAAEVPAPEGGAAPAESAPAPEKPWSVTLDSTFNGKYVWRGVNVVDDPVWQPSATFAWKGLSLNVWGNLDLTDVNGDRRNFTEVDYTLDYSHSVGKATFSVGTIRYVFPHTGFPTTTEVYAGVTLDAPLSPTFKVYKDIDESDGVYANFALSHTVPGLIRFSERASMSLALSAAVGWGDHKNNNFYYAGTDASGLADLTCSVGLPIAIGDHITIKPALNCSRLLDPDARRNMKAAGVDPTNHWLGLSFTFAF
ncbi:MAG TPA: hypothetical protein PLE19_22965 [Planctomycetota bacterium]|nr:hypothetical protein [Planctomycetota bacterium]HRR82947.1 hypothetical protein [Planctomycetota bacterium]